MLKLRKITFYFIYVEILDIITTVVGFSIGMWEGNPLFNKVEFIFFIFLKILATVLVAYALEKKNRYWFDIIILIIAIIPVIINSFKLFLDILLTSGIFNFTLDKIINIWYNGR